MEFRYSTLVDPSTYETEGLCDGIPLRVHKCPDREDIGALRVQEDWRKHVGLVNGYRGGLGPGFSFMSITVPECLPERLEVLSYANELAFLHDDITDNASKEVIDKANKDMFDAFREIVKTGRSAANQFGEKRIQGQLLLEMMAIDRERALTTAKSWATFVKTAAGRDHHKDFKTLDEYIPYRLLDAGQMFWHGMVTFGMALTIPDCEMGLCNELIRPAAIALSLQNDLYSWEKEHKDAIKHGNKNVVNAIWVIMKEQSVTVEEAKLVCKNKVKEVVAEYLQNVERTRGNTTISLDLRRYLEAWQYSLSGNVVWSVYCPRYHEEVDFNELQKLRMKDGVTKHPARHAALTVATPWGAKATGAYRWIHVILLSIAIFAASCFWSPFSTNYHRDSLIFIKSRL